MDQRVIAQPDPPGRPHVEHRPQVGGGPPADPDADHRADLAETQVRARAWPGNTLHTGDHAAPLRRILQKNAQHLPRLVFVDQLESRNVTFFLEDARDFCLEFGHRHVHALVLSGGGVADARQKIGYGIRLHISPNSSTSLLSRRLVFLP